MGFSYLSGITRVANILTILVFVEEFMKCEISDIMTMTVNTVRLAALVLDVLCSIAIIHRQLFSAGLHDKSEQKKHDDVTK